MSERGGSFGAPCRELGEDMAALSADGRRALLTVLGLTEHVRERGGSELSPRMCRRDGAPSGCSGRDAAFEELAGVDVVHACE